MHVTRCPNCGREVKAVVLALAPDFPFCGERCRMADLDRWFTEDYSVPGEAEPSDRDPDYA